MSPDAPAYSDQHAHRNCNIHQYADVHSDSDQHAHRNCNIHQSAHAYSDSDQHAHRNCNTHQYADAYSDSDQHAHTPGGPTVDIGAVAVGLGVGGLAVTWMLTHRPKPRRRRHSNGDDSDEDQQPPRLTLEIGHTHLARGEQELFVNVTDSQGRGVSLTDGKVQVRYRTIQREPDLQSGVGPGHYVARWNVGRPRAAVHITVTGTALGYPLSVDTSFEPG